MEKEYVLKLNEEEYKMLSMFLNDYINDGDFEQLEFTDEDEECYEGIQKKLNSLEE
ncbi:MAG: hypothetical protein LIR40_08155 [Bacteroidota bacterium]|nr:hypothetical protein [Bacteroidota bacterium]